MSTALLIPIYEPTEKCISFLASFSPDEFDRFLVIDDGSGRDFQWIFEKIKEKSPFEVLSYPENHGKGYALKTGVSYLMEKDPNLDFILTSDGDGQHLKKDILHIRDVALSHPKELVLGVRDLNAHEIPKKSKIGNDLSRAYMSWATHIHCMDTQTGLRAIPKNLFQTFLKTPGSHYDFEMNFLIDAAREAPLFEEKIETIYENNNAGSHFKPLLDTARIYRGPLLYCLSLLICWGLDIGLFALFQSFLSIGKYPFLWNLCFAKGISEVVLTLSSLFLCFPRRKGIGARSEKHYFILFLGLGCSCLFLYLFKEDVISPVLLKFLVDLVFYLILFLLSVIWAKGAVDNSPKES